MANTQQNNKRIAKNTLFLYFRQILIMAVTLYTSRLVLHALGVENYGIYNVVGGMVIMFSFLNGALAQATQRYISFGIAKDTIEQQQQTFSMLLNVHIIIAFILLFLCETIGVWILYNKLVIPHEHINDAFWVMQCSIFTLLISITQVPYNASIFGHERMDIYAYISILEVLLKLGIAIILSHHFSNKLLMYGIMIMIAQLIIALIYRYYCYLNFRNCVYRLYWSKTLFKELIGFTGWNLIGNIAWTLNEQGINILINLFFGPAYNAARGIASQISSAVTSFTTNFLGASAPQITKYYAVGDLENCIRLCNKSTKYGFFLFMLVSMPLISILQPILSLWLVEVPPLTATLCMLSLIYVQFRTMGGTLQEVAQATGKVRFFQMTQGLIAITAMPTVYVFYKTGFQIIWYLYIMICMTIINVIAQVIAVHHVFHRYSILTYIKEVVSPALLAFIIPCSTSLYFYRIEQFSLLSIIYCFFVFCLTLISICLIGMNKNERRWVYNIIKSKFKNDKCHKRTIQS